MIYKENEDQNAFLIISLLKSWFIRSTKKSKDCFCYKENTLVGYKLPAPFSQHWGGEEGAGLLLAKQSRPQLGGEVLMKSCHSGETVS